MTEVEINDKVFIILYILGGLILLCVIGLVLRYLKILYEIVCGACKCIHKYICCESKCCKSRSYTEV